jgi:hypothetical protein
MERIYVTVWGKIRKSLKIWLVPLMLYFCATFFFAATSDYAVSKLKLDDAQRTEVLDILYTYGLGSFLLITCWIIAKRFERIEQRPVRKRTKIVLKIFTALYVVSLFITLLCKLLSHYYLGG